MPEFKYREFQESLKQKSFAPVYLFVGTEDFLLEECLSTIIAQTLNEETKGFNLDVMYGSKSSAKDVLSHAVSFPMMSERRVVVVKEFARLVGSDAAKESVAGYLKKPLDSTCLILIDEKPDFRKKPYGELRKNHTVVSFDPLWDNQVPPWIAARVKKLGKEIEIEASRLLHAYVGNSLRSLQNEIDKLFIYVDERPSITAEDITRIVGATKDFTVFDLQNAIGRKDGKKAMAILQRMLESGESPQLIIVMLTRFFLQLWKLGELRAKRASEAEIVGELRISPYFIKSTMEFLSYFSPPQVENAFSVLCDTDVALKSSGGDQHVLLDLLLHNLLHGTAERLSEATPS